jgi:ribose/xylose/arabinose/galactoside ABC-type transport system permease subunit
MVANLDRKDDIAIMVLKSDVSSKSKLRSIDFFGKYGVLVGLAVVCLIMTVLSPVFLSSANLLSVVRQVAVYGLLAIGVTMVVLTGEIDLSVGSIVAISGVTAAMAQKAGWGLIPSILIPLALGMTLGLVVGLLVAKGGVPSFVATLGMMGIARGICLVLTNGFPISGFQENFKWIGGGELLFIPIPMILLLVVTVIVQMMLKRTSFGRNLYAIGGSRKAAFYSGIKVEWNLIKAFILSGGFAALGGIVLASRLDAAETVAGQGYELSAIAAVVIGGASLSGGKGTVYGTLLGTLFIGVIANGLTLLAVSSYWQQIVQGLIIILAVLMNTMRKGSTQIPSNG